MGRPGPKRKTLAERFHPRVDRVGVPPMPVLVDHKREVSFR